MWDWSIFILGHTVSFPVSHHVVRLCGFMPSEEGQNATLQSQNQKMGDGRGEGRGGEEGGWRGKIGGRNPSLFSPEIIK